MFHSQDGLFFTRLPGDIVEVRVSKQIDKAEHEIFVTELPITIFASVIASMSNCGEDSKTYQEALTFLTRAPAEIAEASVNSN